MSPLDHWIPQVLLAVGVVHWATWAFLVLRGQMKYAIAPAAVSVGLFFVLSRSGAFVEWAEGMQLREWDQSAQTLGLPTVVFLYAFAISAWIAGMIECFLPTNPAAPYEVFRLRKNVAQLRLVVVAAFTLFAFSKARDTAISQQQFAIGVGIVILVTAWALFMPRRKGAAS